MISVIRTPTVNAALLDATSRPISSSMGYRPKTPAAGLCLETAGTYQASYQTERVHQDGTPQYFFGTKQTTVAGAEHCSMRSSHAFCD